MLKTKFSTLLLLVFVCTYLKAQTSAPPVDLIQVRAAAPEVASLGKFGNIPVSNSTGVPSINIPITTINVGAIDLPISLDYHAGGIKVDEVSSCVGLGWALNGNGMVFRNMVGLPDETSTYGYIASPEARSVTMSGTSAYATYLYNVHKGNADAEPDIYQYNFNGQSGKFLFKHDGTIMQIPVTNNKIAYTGGNFIITDAKGVVCIFNEKQNTTSTADSRTYVSQWRLTKMVDVNTTDTIYLSYETACNDSYEHPVSANYTLGMVAWECKIQDLGGGASEASINTTLGQQESDFYQTITHYESYLKQITWKGGKVVFVNACDRTDVTGSGERLDEVDVYALQNGVYTQTKRMKLYQSYFFSNPKGNTVTEKNYRLRLDSVALLPIGTSDQPQVFSMTYNNGLMAPRESFIQDRWGFNNGAWSGGGYMAKQSFVYNGKYYNFGSATRSSDSLSMMAYTISSITYPTKGKSVFQFEPHRYYTNLLYTEQKTLGATSTGGVQAYDTISFSVDSNSYAYQVQAYIKPFAGYTDVSDRPRVSLYDRTTSSLIYYGAQTPGDESKTFSESGIAVMLIPGHQYWLTVNLYTTTNTNMYASIYVTYLDSIPAKPEIKIGGGLRVKDITNYDVTGKFLGRQKYEYGDDNTGVVLTPQYYQDMNYEKVVHRVGCAGGSIDAACNSFYEYMSDLNPVPGYSLVFHSNSIYPTSQYAGSPVLYRKVTRYDVDSTNVANGKTVFYYQVFQDGSTLNNNMVTNDMPRTYDVNGVYVITNTWKNGYQTGEDIYKSVGSNFVLQNRQRTTYDFGATDYLYVLKIHPKYASSGCESESDAAQADVYAVPIYTGVVLPTSIADTTYDDAGGIMSTIQNISYGSNLLPSSRQVTKSNRDNLVENISYPADLAVVGNVYSKMVNRNIISPIVKTQRLVAGQQTTLTNFTYNDWFGDSTILMPSSISVQERNNPADVRVKYNSFDRKGNILQQQKANDMNLCYIWDYQSLYPIAIARNTAVTDIAFTSFEAEGTGNWTGIISGNIQSSGGLTGSRYYNITSAGLSKTGLAATATYIVSYYSKNGAYTVAGTSPVRTGRTITRSGNSWTYYEHQVTGTTIQISGTGGIDELRLYPIDAQMNTYTYAPLVGMTSQCDANNKLSFYELDGLGRLKVVRDQDGNIVKTYDYHYRQ